MGMQWVELETAMPSGALGMGRPLLWRKAVWRWREVG